MSVHHYRTLGLACIFLAASASAAELSYTFIDFQYVTKAVEAQGTQFPVPIQSVEVVTDAGDGIAIAGSLAIGENFFIAGRFQSSIVDLSAVITSPFVTNLEEENFDVIQSRLSAGYRVELSDNFDLVFDVSYDSKEYDFGSLAGEDFDMAEAGAGASAGFRWNPTRSLEIFGSGIYSSTAFADIDQLTFSADTSYRLGFFWYFFEDLGFGVDYEDGQVETVSFSMRFSFGELTQ